MAVKLNLGSGPLLLDGFINVDISPACKPDLLADLNRTPWPLQSDVASEVLLSHVLEHLGADGDGFLRIMKELYRVCRDGARIHVFVPHPRHDDFLIDPTHVRAILPETFLLFSKAKNKEWQSRGVANTPLGLYLDVDFQVERAVFTLDEPWKSMRQRGEIDEETLQQTILTKNNIVKQVEVTLLAVKPAATLPLAKI